MGVGILPGLLRLFLQHAGWRLLWAAMAWLADALVPTAAAGASQGQQMPQEAWPGDAWQSHASVQPL
eukprot:15443373-Alexandrium_andersonii.AAC.1